MDDFATKFRILLQNDDKKHVKLPKTSSPESTKRYSIEENEQKTRDKFEKEKCDVYFDK